MNVNAVAPNLTRLAPLDQKAQKAVSLEPEQVELGKVEQLSAKELLAKTFYTREEEPWKSRAISYSEGNGIIIIPMTKADYLKSEKTMLALDLEIQHYQFDEFRAKLIELRPDLSGKQFSYTLGDDVRVKIIDPDNIFSEEQLEWVTDSLNNAPDFTKMTQQCAKRMMALVDHDNETFGNRFSLNLMNFQDTVDLGKLISIKDPERQQAAWIKQIEQNAERRVAPLVDVLA